jgi:hypothetical protein
MSCLLSTVKSHSLQNHTHVSSNGSRDTKQLTISSLRFITDRKACLIVLTVEIFIHKCFLAHTCHYFTMLP